MKSISICLAVFAFSIDNVRAFTTPVSRSLAGVQRTPLLTVDKDSAKSHLMMSSEPTEKKETTWDRYAEGSYSDLLFDG